MPISDEDAFDRWVIFNQLVAPADWPGDFPTGVPLPAAAKSLLNGLIPANVQAAAAFKRLVLSEGMKWIRVHGGMPNVTDFIAQLEQRPEFKRWRVTSGRYVVPTESTVRKIVRRHLDVTGKRGRPKRP